MTTTCVQEPVRAIPMATFIRLCQYEEGPPTLLRSTHQQVTIPAWELEDVLKSHVSTEAVPAAAAAAAAASSSSVDIMTRTDPHLVDAQRPCVPLETIMGVWEDTLSNPDLKVNVWEPVVDHARSDGACCCQEIHSEWTRKPLRAPKKQEVVDTIQVMWVDIRNAKHLSLRTLAGCCHFLRTLLGTSHAAVPWSDNEEELPPVVALVLPREASEALIEFRTGDASPSYFLHSVSQLQLPTTSTLWWLGQAQDGPRMDATLLIYKTMPPRENVSIEYPLKKSPDEELPDGCLWERFRKHEDEEDDEETKDEYPIEDEEVACRMLCPPYISHTQDYPNLLEPLLERLSTLREEALSIPKWTAWPERQHYRSSSANGNDNVSCWTVFPLCHCFPANVVENRKWIDATCAYVPRTVALLKETLGDTLRTALFSRLDPETALEAHTGWQDLANYVIRVHIPLVVPPDGLCGTWVDGCAETHHEGRPLCFDDAKVHRAFNYSKEERVVLILDLARPSYLPLGHATGGHTEELDSFIAQLT